LGDASRARQKLGWKPSALLGARREMVREDLKEPSAIGSQAARFETDHRHE